MALTGPSAIRSSAIATKTPKSHAKLIRRFGFITVLYRLVSLLVKSLPISAESIQMMQADWLGTGSHRRKSAQNTTLPGGFLAAALLPQIGQLPFELS